MKRDYRAHTIRRPGFLILCISTLACNFVANMVTTPTPIPTATLTITPTFTITPTAAITLTPTPFYPIELGREVKVRSGGFSIARFKDYDVFSDNGGVYMTSDDEKVRVSAFAFADPGDYSISGLARQFAENITKRYPDIAVGEPVKGTFGEIDMVTVDYNGTADDEPLQGRFSIYRPEDSKLVYLIVEAASELRWEREGQRAYEQVTGSLSIFPIEVWENCPIHKNGSYGASPDWPIKIGGGLRDGEQRIEDYLDALLSARSEPVGYYRNGTVEGRYGNLDEYFLYWGNNGRRTLYFDIYQYEELFAPSGFTCSAPLPMSPAQ